MSEADISKMDFKQLRNEVQLLRDELAIFKRKYEDVIYNLDSDNFGKSFTVEQDNMKAQIKISADAIKTMVSDTDLQETLEKYSTIEQSATEIELAVTRVNNSTDEKLKEYSTIRQTADAITSTVSKEYVTNLIGDSYVTNALLSSEISQSADEIYLSVSKEYETKEDADAAYDNLDSYISSISVKADGISTKVSNLETFKTSVFSQTEYGFTLDGDQTTFTGVIFLTDNDGVKRFAISHDESQGYPQVFMHAVDGSSMPIILGDTANEEVYIGLRSNNQRVATRSWVENNADIVARFG